MLMRRESVWLINQSLEKMVRRKTSIYCRLPLLRIAGRDVERHLEEGKLGIAMKKKPMDASVEKGGLHNSLTPPQTGTEKKVG